MMRNLRGRVARDDEVIDADLDRLAEDLVQRIVDHVAATTGIIVRKRQIASNNWQQAVHIGASGKLDDGARTCNRKQNQTVNACLLACGGEFRRHVGHIWARLLMIIN